MAALISSRSLPEGHPWKDKVGPELFDLVFSHLDAGPLATITAAEATAASDYGAGVLTSIYYDGDTQAVVFGYEKS